MNRKITLPRRLGAYVGLEKDGYCRDWSRKGAPGDLLVESCLYS